MNLRDLGIKIRGNRWRLDINGPMETGNYVARIFRGDVLLAAGIDRDLPMAVQDALDDAAGAVTRRGEVREPAPATTTRTCGCGSVMEIRSGRGRQRSRCAECQRAMDVQRSRVARAKRERSAAE